MHTLDSHIDESKGCSTAEIDNLVYSYKANSDKIHSISDYSPISNRNKGYNKLRNAAYSYDANGNMTFDQRSGANITYNFLNLPSRMQSNSVTIDYVYLANGTKLSQKVTNSDGIDEKVQFGIVEYTDSQEIQRVYNDKGSFSFVF